MNTTDKLNNMIQAAAAAVLFAASSIAAAACDGPIKTSENLPLGALVIGADGKSSSWSRPWQSYIPPAHDGPIRSSERLPENAIVINQAGERR